MYLNVDEIEAAIENLAAAYPGLCERIAAPNPTHEGRSTAILRLGRNAADAVDGVLLLGGLHAREWVPPDALVSLAADLLEAANGDTGLGYGAASFTAGQVQSLFSDLNLFIYPCVNPDGRGHSQTADNNWRKNRRPAPAPSGGPSCVGVDLNRNFDFLWDHLAKFAPDSGVRTSADPCDPQVYRGPEPNSEPETQNVIWALDTFDRIRWHVDVHSYTPLILHIWGDDQNQSDDPAKNFTNAAFDGSRGLPDDDAYREYIEPGKLDTVTNLSNRMHDAIKAVRGSAYEVDQAFGLYPTSGTSDDYASSRNIVDPKKTKCLGFTIECGTEFQPPFAEAEEVIREVSAGLVTFCLEAPALTGELAIGA